MSTSFHFRRKQPMDAPMAVTPPIDPWDGAPPPSPSAPPTIAHHASTQERVTTTTPRYPTTQTGALLRETATRAGDALEQVGAHVEAAGTRLSRWALAAIGRSHRVLTTPVELLARDVMDAGTTVFGWVYAQASHEAGPIAPRATVDGRPHARPHSAQAGATEEPEPDDEDLRRQRDWGIG